MNGPEITITPPPSPPPPPARPTAWEPIGAVTSSNGGPPPPAPVRPATEVPFPRAYTPAGAQSRPPTAPVFRAPAAASTTSGDHQRAARAPLRTAAIAVTFVAIFAALLVAISVMAEPRPAGPPAAPTATGAPLTVDERLPDPQSANVSPDSAMPGAALPDAALPEPAAEWQRQETGPSGLSVEVPGVVMRSERAGDGTRPRIRMMDTMVADVSIGVVDYDYTATTSDPASMSDTQLIADQLTGLGEMSTTIGEASPIGPVTRFDFTTGAGGVPTPGIGRIHRHGAHIFVVLVFRQHPAERSTSAVDQIDHRVWSSAQHAP